jgi:hypothetical protein
MFLVGTASSKASQRNLQRSRQSDKTGGGAARKSDEIARRITGRGSLVAAAS